MELPWSSQLVGHHFLSVAAASSAQNNPSIGQSPSGYSAPKALRGSKNKSKNIGILFRVL